MLHPRQSVLPLALVLLSSLAATAVGQTLEPAPRRPIDAGPVTWRELPLRPALQGAPIPAAGHRLVVKFRDAVRARAADGGGLRALGAGDVRAAERLIDRAGARLAKHIAMPDEALAALEARAAARSGRAQPDLAGILAVDAPHLAPAELVALGEALRALPEVEYAHLELLGCPPPGDIAPTTPNLTPQQDYLDPDPGIDAQAAWALGVRGAGVRLSDCEYGWDPEHEDFNDRDLNLEPNQTIDPGVFANNWDDHGTAALGSAAGVENAYGVTGIASDVETYTYPEWTVQQGFRRASAISFAISNSDPGDVVMLEMQTVNFGDDYGPAELNPTVWNLCRMGSDAGVIVVGAAGNGNENLDAGIYSTYRSWGDSGAIIVGAGSPNTSHDKIHFSTYGDRVNLQGWGNTVVTMGYGGLATYGGDPHQTYTWFSGTSSATPLVASACCLVQSKVLANDSDPMTPQEMRDLLVQTGTPQGTGGHIGPLPDVGAALDALCPEFCPTIFRYCPNSANQTGFPANILTTGSTSVAANDLVFTVSPLAQGNNGLVIYSPDSTSTPLGNGTLCVGDQTLGFVLRLPAEAPDAFGVMTHALDMTNTPLPGVGDITPGSTWFFQAWNRDFTAGGEGFNFSDALEIRFTP